MTLKDLKLETLGYFFFGCSFAGLGAAFAVHSWHRAAFYMFLIAAAWFLYCAWHMAAHLMDSP